MTMTTPKPHALITLAVLALSAATLLLGGCTGPAPNAPAPTGADSPGLVGTGSGGMVAAGAGNVATGYAASRLGGDPCPEAVEAATAAARPDAACTAVTNGTIVDTTLPETF